MTATTPRSRILFIAPFPPPVHGASVVSQQIRDSKFIGETFTCDFVDLSTSRNLSEVGRRIPVKCWRFLTSISTLFWKLVTHHYDLCYLAITCHGLSFLKDAPFVLLCKLFRCRIVIHQHNKGMSEDVRRWPYRRLLPLTYRNATVILLSERLYPDIERFVRHENVTICPNGIVVHKEGGSRRINDVPMLLYFSNMLESKGAIDLLDALALLREKGVSFHCVFAGAETREIDVKRFSLEVKKRHLEGVTRFLGPKMGKEKEHLFTTADIFVFPTYYKNECFPLVILEAMAHHLPVITTDEGGIPDIVKDGENGLICGKRDPQSLADCMLRMIENKELRVRMGKDGYKKYKQSFTEEQFEERMVGILSKLTAK